MAILNLRHSPGQEASLSLMDLEFFQSMLVLAPDLFGNKSGLDSLTLRRQMFKLKRRFRKNVCLVVNNAVTTGKILAS